MSSGFKMERDFDAVTMRIDGKSEGLGYCSNGKYLGSNCSFI